MKALACTAPLHVLDNRKGKLEWLDASVYQMSEIALHTIDQVAIAMDFDTGAGHRKVIERTVPFIAAQAPFRSPEEHAQVASWVLDSLVNVGTVDRSFQRVYGQVNANGEYIRLRFEFKLLVELAAPNGEIYLRATDEAINVLVGALDTDIESAQIAAEVKLENLISRGRLADARLAAEQARYRSVQFGEALRSRLEATRRDVRTVDWERDIPQLLAEALDHIQGRYQVENAILKNITAARDDAEDPQRKSQAADLVDIVADCIRRHTQLQTRLLSARMMFRAEQDRQLFAGRPQRAAPDLYGQLLEPILGLTIEDARGPLESYFAASAGPRPPTLPSLSSLIDVLIRPPSEHDSLRSAVPEPDLLPPRESGGYTNEQWDTVDHLLNATSEPRLLSELLAQLEEAEPDLHRLLALRAVQAVSPSVTSSIRHGRQRLLIAVPAGRELVAVAGGIGGDDLIVANATVVEVGDDE
ncbi:hypothetical protein Q3V37_17435 [Micromonospora profundi]|uniref:Uncharacterized protein n=1 Tax=Micromonospora profundi TaxID=1420889 RepID=A0AAJ6HRY4_9ACTN|nr:hypothetical protein [Micromonospora profundi]WLS43204.1 hypothetical protein Q3V37_17435 [Micromonospora profundi]